MAVLAAWSPRVEGDTLDVSVHPTTNTDDQHETTPALGFDGLSNIVVYTHVPAGSDLGDIRYQRVTATGAPMGSSERISSLATDDRLNDVSGSYIVYTALNPIDSSSGVIKLYDISNASTISLIPAPDTVSEARIDGDIVAWVQGAEGASRIEMMDLTWPMLTSITISGANPAVEVEVGSRYVVWEEFDGISSNVVAYDLWLGVEVAVATQPDRDEEEPATFGDYIVWEENLAGATSIWARNVTAGTPAFVVANPAGAIVQNPSINGDLIGYESNHREGNFDVYVYRISDGDTFLVTDGDNDEILNNIYGNLVAFVDVGDDLDVAIAHITFIPDPVDPCAPLGGDADGDEVCGSIDNCPTTANPGQADSDGDGIGDACDLCGSGSGGFNDSDGDGIGDACDACPNDPANDIDGDSVCGNADNCPVTSNFSQLDVDGDGAGDSCDSCMFDPANDPDGDGICAPADNCSSVANPGQEDADVDGIGDACDEACDCDEEPPLDADGDSVLDEGDNCPLAANADQSDLDGDGAGDACDACPLDSANDADGDGLCLLADNCPLVSNADQSDLDADGIGDACDENLLQCTAENALLAGLQAGHIRTVAGSNAPGWSGDGGAATDASLNLPHDVFVDQAGNLYIADSANHRVRRVDGLTGIITTVAGNGSAGSAGDDGPATSAELNEPRWVTVDEAGNLFIAETVGHRIRRVDAATGIITTVAGGGASAINGPVAATDVALLVPSGMTFDATGNLFIVETGWDRILRIHPGADGAITGAPDEMITVVAGVMGGGFAGDGGPATNARFANPEDIAFDPDGNLLIVDRVNNRIRLVTTGADGEITGGEDENVVTIAGGGIATGDGAAAANAVLRLPRGIAVNAAGDIFISEADALRVRRIDAATGLIATVAGGGASLGEDVLATTAQLFTSRGIATDRDGNLFIAILQGRIRAVRLAPAGVHDTVPPATDAARSPEAAGGWNKTPVTITLTAVDNADGCGVLEIHYVVNGGTETVVAGDSVTIHITAEGVTSLSYYAVDAAGNVEPTTVIEIRIDMTPPAITITRPAAGSVLLLNQSVTSEYACSDALSGLASCAGPIASGMAIDTTAAGAKTFTVDAMDAAGNAATLTHQYSVQYAFEGFFAPLANLPMTNRGPAGRTYPVKFVLRDANGTPISDPAAINEVALVAGACGAAAADVAGEESSLEVSGLKYDAETGVWHFNWKTLKSQAGCWLLELRLTDGTVHRVSFELR